MRSELLIYGVTGYTGGLISRLAAAGGLPHVAAGRDLERVTARADPLMVPARAFSLGDAARIDRALQGVAVVLNAAGPFDETALPLAAACLRGGVHYLDLSPGAAAIEALLGLDARAREAGVMLMPGAGFAVVPTDAAAARLRRRMPEARRLRLACAVTGRVSRGSRLAMVREFRQAGARRRDGDLVTAWAAEEMLTIDLGDGPLQVGTDPWRGDLVTAWWSSVYSDVDTYAAYPRPWRWLLRSRRLGPPWALAGSGAAEAALAWLARRLPEGPDEAELAAGSTRIWAQAEDGAGGRVGMRLRGPHLHLFTARVALWVARRVLAGSVQVGFQTPATAFGPDLLDRLAEEIEDLEIEPL